MANKALAEIDLSFIKDIQLHFANTKAAVDAAFPITLNETARKALEIGGKAMVEQVRFPPNYFNEPKRFYIDEFATALNSKAVVSARARGTSLYRFALGSPTPDSTRGWEDGEGAVKLGINTASSVRRKTRKDTGKTRLRIGVQVEVKPGHVIDMPTAFVVNFNGNLQVAIKLKNGRFPPGFDKKIIDAEPLGKRGDLYVLYGPSVDQVFDKVRGQIEPDVMAFAQAEFRRQFFVRAQK
jgi:hypothetical protein